MTNKFVYSKLPKIFIIFLMIFGSFLLFMAKPQQIDTKTTDILSLSPQKSDIEQKQTRASTVGRWDYTTITSKSGLFDMSTQEWINKLQLSDARILGVNVIIAPQNWDVINNFLICFTTDRNPTPANSNQWVYIMMRRNNPMTQDFNAGSIKMTIGPGASWSDVDGGGTLWVTNNILERLQTYVVDGFIPDSNLSVKTTYPKTTSARLVAQSIGSGTNFNKDALGKYLDLSKISENRGAKIKSLTSTYDNVKGMVTLNLSLERFYEQGVKQTSKTFVLTDFPNVDTTVLPRNEAFSISAQTALESFSNNEGIITNSTAFQKYVEYVEFPDNISMQIIDKSFSNKEGILDLTIKIDKYYEKGLLYNKEKTIKVLIQNFDNQKNTSITPFIKSFDVAAQTALESFSSDLLTVTQRPELEKYVEIKHLPIETTFQLKNIEFDNFLGTLSFQIISNQFYLYSYLEQEEFVANISLDNFDNTRQTLSSILSTGDYTQSAQDIFYQISDGTDIIDDVLLYQYVEISNIPLNTNFQYSNLAFSNELGQITLTITIDKHYQDSYLTLATRVFDIKIDGFYNGTTKFNITDFSRKESFAKDIAKTFTSNEIIDRYVVWTDIPEDTIIKYSVNEVNNFYGYIDLQAELNQWNNYGFQMNETKTYEIRISNFKPISNWWFWLIVVGVALIPIIWILRHIFNRMFVLYFDRIIEEGYDQENL